MKKKSVEYVALIASMFLLFMVFSLHMNFGEKVYKLSNLVFGQPTDNSVVALVASGLNPCNFYISSAVSVADGRGNFSGVRPGDTVCITAGSRDELTLKNFQGTPISPIVFRNSGGAVVFNGGGSAGLKVQNSRYLRVTGSADSQNYGIRIDGSYDFGINIGWKTSDFELDHIEVARTNSNAGLKANTKSSCSDGSDNDYDYDGDGKITNDLDDVVTQANFTQFNTVIHDVYLHDTAHEGFYIGSNRTVYASSGQGKSSDCPVVPKDPLNPVLDTVKMYNNKVERSGWDSVNVKGAISNCYIYNNTVLENSIANEPGQEGGINLALNSKCDVYGNVIKDGYSRAIKLNGTGGKVYNNIVINSGRGYPVGDNVGSAIFSGSAELAGSPYVVANNTIIDPKGYGVYFAYSNYSGNRIQNNIIVNPQAFSQQGDKSYINVSGATAQVTNNLKTLNIGSVNFANYSAGNYSLLSSSPAVDKGIDLSAQGITVDINGGLRPAGLAFDLGAYEYGSSITPPPTADTIAPSTPTNLQAVATSPSQINLTWSASIDNVGTVGYKIYRGGVQFITTTATSYSDTGLSPSTLYSYTVAAYDAAGNTSTKSASVSATTLPLVDVTAPFTPTNLQAMVISTSQINLSWDVSADNIGTVGYKIFRDGTRIATTPINFYSDTGLSRSTRYSYTVAAYDAAGNTSTKSASVSATTHKFLIGDKVHTTKSLKVRSKPTTSGTVLCTKGNNVYGYIRGGPIKADGYIWWDVNYNSGCDGWSAEDWLSR